MAYSDCCGAETNETDMGICPECLEHCSFEEECETCGGDGKETCNNPDHGFIDGVGGEVARLGCPCCGHDPKHKVKNGGDCEDCNGTGRKTIE
jgi:hypothetical protein